MGRLHAKTTVRIPFERALDFANKEKITELLYPLFVHNIGALLYHPTNQTRTSQVMAAAERRKQEQQQSQMRNAQQGGGALPSLHHHSMGLGGPQPQLASHANMGRPSMDRAHTFPTPPTSASSVLTSMGAQDNYQQWPQQGMNGGQQANPMSIDTGLSNAARSMPATPATTPPGTSLHSMQTYPPASQPYDNSRSLYNASSAQQQQQQSSYPGPNPSAQDSRAMYAQTGYVKNESMGPPSSRPATQSDTKTTTSDGMMHPGNGDHVSHVSHPQGEEEAEHEHDGEYTHDSSSYDASRNSYYSNTAPVQSMPSEHHLAPELSTSPNQTASGRATPRTAQPPQPYYTQGQGYNAPLRAPAPLKALDYTSDTRAQTNGTPGNDVYTSQTDMGASMQQNGYPSQHQQPTMSASSAGIKRGRDDDDDERPDSVGSMDIKRRKTLMDVPAAGYDSGMNRAAPAIASQRRR